LTDYKQKDPGKIRGLFVERGCSKGLHTQKKGITQYKKGNEKTIVIITPLEY